MQEVLNQFDILNGILSDIDPTLHGRHLSTEMVMTAKVWGEQYPDASITELGRSDIAKFDKIFGREMKTGSFTISNLDQVSESYYSLTLAPLNRSPRYYYVQLVNREKELTKVLGFSTKGKEIIKNAVVLLEEGI